MKRPKSTNLAVKTVIWKPCWWKLVASYSQGEAANSVQRMVQLELFELRKGQFGDTFANMAPGEVLERENKTESVEKVLAVDDVPAATKEEAENIKNEANELFKGL